MSNDVYEVLREGVNDNGGVSASDVSLVNPLRACRQWYRVRVRGTLARFYRLLTECGAGLLTSSCALTFCNPAVIASICFCCWAFAASCFSTIEKRSATVKCNQGLH
jgi:hypothetical protein